jgi:hydrogenase expression/formation protein HypC
MCLGVPGRVVEVRDDRGMAMATVDFGGVSRDVCLATTPDAGVDDWVLVHAGFAITVVDADAAAEAIELWQTMAEPPS